MNVIRKPYKNGFFVDLVEYYAEFADNGWYTNSEIETQDWIIDHCKPDWFSLDVGSHIGYYSMLLSYLSPFGAVHAFDVCEPTIYMMRANMRYNEEKFGRDFSNIFIIQTALGDQRGIFKETVWQTGITAGNYGETNGEFAFDTIDNYAQMVKLPRLDFIKVDVDGWDFDVILGAEETIKRFKPHMVVETNNLHWRNRNGDMWDKYMKHIQYSYKTFDAINSFCWPKDLK